MNASSHIDRLELAIITAAVAPATTFAATRGACARAGRRRVARWLLCTALAPPCLARWQQS